MSFASPGAPCRYQVQIIPVPHLRIQITISPHRPFPACTGGLSPQTPGFRNQKPRNQNPGTMGSTNRNPTLSRYEMTGSYPAREANRASSALSYHDPPTERGLPFLHHTSSLSTPIHSHPYPRHDSEGFPPTDTSPQGTYRRCPIRLHYIAPPSARFLRRGRTPRGIPGITILIRSAAGHAPPLIL